MLTADPGDTAKAAPAKVTRPTTDKDQHMLTYPVPAIRHAGDGRGVEITPGGLRIIYDQLKAVIDDKVAGLRDLAMYDHRCARAELRNLIDLIDTLENRHGLR
jgi:hypothetical protein